MTATAESTVAADLITGRRLKVLVLVACGYSNERIAEALFVHLETAKLDLRHVRTVLGAKNRAHAVALGFRHGVIRPQDITGGVR